MSIIEIKGLKKRFREADALKGIDLQVNPGDVFGIIGMSGAGKSTLMRCLVGLEKPSEGEILLCGEKVSGASPEELRLARHKIGMIFQHFNLFSSRTARENIEYPLEIQGIKPGGRADELLALVGLEGKGDHYPSQLSGGEKQRVAIARALATSPAVLLCDEATSALDPRTTQSILELLARLNRELGLTLLLITHEMEVIKRICTHVAVLEGGEIVEQGQAAKLFATPQHPTTKRFLQSLTHTIEEHQLQRREGQELLRLIFTGRSAGEPVISRLIRGYQVEVNILFGGIDVLTTETVGNLVVALSGAIEERRRAKEFLHTSGVAWEVL